MPSLIHPVHFLQKFSQERKKELASLTPEVIDIFLAHPWPGNVRELENVIEHAIIVAKKNKIIPKDLPQYLVLEPSAARNPLTLEDHERSLVQQALEESNWNKHQAAKRLNITRSTLYGKIKRYGLEKRDH